MAKNNTVLISEYNMPEDFKVAGITANSNKAKLNTLASEFNCPFSLTSEEGTDGIQRLIDETKPDIVVNGIAGSAGLLPSKIVLDNKISLALANKETVVMAWPLIKSLANRNSTNIIPPKSLIQDTHPDIVISSLMFFAVI